MIYALDLQKVTSKLASANFNSYNRFQRICERKYIYQARCSTTMNPHIYWFTSSAGHLSCSILWQPHLWCCSGIHYNPSCGTIQEPIVSWCMCIWSHFCRSCRPDAIYFLHELPFFLLSYLQLNMWKPSWLTPNLALLFFDIMLKRKTVQRLNFFI